MSARTCSFCERIVILPFSISQLDFRFWCEQSSHTAILAQAIMAQALLAQAILALRAVSVFGFSSLSLICHAEFPSLATEWRSLAPRGVATAGTGAKPEPRGAPSVRVNPTQAASEASLKVARIERCMGQEGTAELKSWQTTLDKCVTHIAHGQPDVWRKLAPEAVVKFEA